MKSQVRIGDKQFHLHCGNSEIVILGSARLYRSFHAKNLYSVLSFFLYVG